MKAFGDMGQIARLRLKIECKTSFMTKLLCYNQKIIAPCESRRTSIFTSYIFQYG